ncbi:MAG: hypothetical protein LBC20_01110 [Planctomycetaceae bacterium]|jgi:hypothetical protein|nr:hypothetical protein [Planctomycetaceae bacterium]
MLAEYNYENAILELFRDDLKYNVVCGYDIKRDYHSPLFVERFKKLLTIFFYSRLLQKILQNTNIVILTDRNDWDNQLYTQFYKYQDYLQPMQ